MAQAMLGKLPLSAVRGPRDTLEEHLAGPNGPQWLDWLKCLNRKENPFLEPYPRNDFGHYVVSFIAPRELRLGIQEIRRLREKRFVVEPEVDTLLLRPTCHHDGSYDEAHRLVPGKQYSVALVPVRSLHQWDQTLEKLRGEVAAKFGYVQPVAGLIPALMRIICADRMRQMKMEYITAAHKTIGEGPDYKLLMEAGESEIFPRLRAISAHRKERWNQDGAFVYMTEPELIELD